MQAIPFIAALILACSPSADKAETSTSDTSGTDSADTAQPTTPWTPGTIRVDDAPPDTQVRAPDLVIGPDGTLYVSWVDYRDGEKDTFVRTSSNGGASWSESVQVDGEDIEAMAGGGQQPYLLLGEDTLYVLMTAQDYEGAPTVVIYESALGGTLSFSGPTPIGRIESTSAVAYAKGSIDSTGDVWVAWLGYTLDEEYEETSFLVTARASDGYAPVVPAAPVEGMPCECCRLDIQHTSTGDTLLAYRNNEDDIRDQYVLRAAAGSSDFAQGTLGSQTHPLIDYCPAQGPRIAERADGSHLLVWSDDDRIHASTSTDQGVSWTPTEGRATQGVLSEAFEGSPTLTVTEDDTLYMSVETSTSRSVLLRSSGGIDELELLTELSTESGTLGSPVTVRSGAGHVAVVGVADRTSAWIYLVE
jgi:hypothetical protein